MPIKVQPKNKVELMKIIEDTIKKKGYNCNLNFIDTSCIEDMSYLFSKSKFNGDISCWDVSNVDNMRGMFLDSEFNGNISKWNIHNVFDMTFAFMKSKFSNNISKWNTRNVKLKLLCFEGCPLEKKPEFQPIFKIN